MKKKNRERRIFRVDPEHDMLGFVVRDPRNDRKICRCPSRVAATRICNALNAQERAIAAKPRG